MEGTTDITRTFHYGEPTDSMKQRYTEVLLGSIALASLTLPDKTLDTSVDLATRQFLFRQGLNYRHGTGHGIGRLRLLTPIIDTVQTMASTVLDMNIKVFGGL